MLPSSALKNTPFHRLADALLSTAPLQRARLAQAGHRSAGLGEHHAGEAVAQTLQRAERALHEAKTQGGAHAVAA